jgi:hypothetical protein
MAQDTIEYYSGHIKQDITEVTNLLLEQRKAVISLSTEVSKYLNLAKMGNTSKEMTENINAAINAQQKLQVATTNYSITRKQQVAIQKAERDEILAINKKVAEEEKKQAKVLADEKKRLAKETAENNKKIAAEEKELNRLIREEEKAKTAELKAQKQQEIQARKDAIAIHKQEQKEVQQLAKYVDDINKAQAKLEKRAATELKRLDELNNAYNKLKARYNEAANAAKTLESEAILLQNEIEELTTKELQAVNANDELAAASIRTSIGFKKIEFDAKALEAGRASDAAGRLSKQLLALEQRVGQSQRQVGNYNAVLSSFNQIVREAPNAAFGLQAFLISISNNLPIFTDALAQAKAEGKSTGMIFRELAKGFFSFTSLVPLGITLLLAIVPALAKAKEATKEEKEALSELNQQREKQAKFLGEEISKLDDLRRKAEDVTASYVERGAAVDALQKNYPEYFSQLEREKILNGEVEGTYNSLTESIRRRSEITIAFDKVQQAIEEREKIRADKRAKQNASANNVFIYDQRDLDLEEKMANDRVERAEKDLKKLQDVNNAISAGYLKEDKEAVASFEEKAKADALLTEKERKERDKRIKQAEKEAERQKKLAEEIAELRRRIALSGAELNRPGNIKDDFQIEFDNSDDIIRINRQAAEKIFQLKKEYSDKGLKIDADYFKRELEIINSFSDELEYAQRSNMLSIFFDKQSKQADATELKKLIEEGRSQVESSNRRLNYDLTQLNEEYQSGRIKSTEEFEKRQLDITKKYAKERLQLELDNLGKQIPQLTGDARIAAINKQVDIQKQISDIDNQTTTQQINNLIELKEKYFEIYQAIADFVSQIGRNITENELGEIEKRKAGIDIELANKKEAASASATTQLEFERIVAGAEAQAAADREQLRQEELKAKQKQAIFDKAQAVFTITIETAKAIAASLKNPALIPAIVTLGAVQLATVLAAPLPQYFAGTEDHPGGKFIAAEGNKPEIEVRPDGKMRLLTKEGIYDAPKHTRIIPNSEIYSVFPGMSPQMFKTGQPVDLSELVRETQKNNRYLRQIANNTIPQQRSGTLLPSERRN